MPDQTPAQTANTAPIHYPNVYINYYGPITSVAVQNIKNTLIKIKEAVTFDKIHLLLSSSGGAVSAGITLYNFLKGFPCHLVTYNIGSVDSIANVIFLAGDERIACPQSSFLFHGVSFDVNQHIELNLYKLKELVSLFEEDQNKISGIITRCTSLKANEVDQFFREGRSISANEAKSRGIAHKIEDLSIPNNAPVINIDISGSNSNS